jgi:hypothetical protein
MENKSDLTKFNQIRKSSTKLYTVAQFTVINIVMTDYNSDSYYNTITQSSRSLQQLQRNKHIVESSN